MKYCSECGNELTLKECENDGVIPYCVICKEFRFPMFNSAVSSVMFNQSKDKILMIQQYGRTSNILVAGYINKGENANQALIREVKEEVALNVIHYIYNDNVYFDKSNTLIHNFITYVDSEEFALTDEVDKAQWFTIDEAIKNVKEKSLAKNFLFKALIKLNLTNTLFIYEEERIYMNNSDDQLIAEVTFPLNNNYYDINHTFIDESLRGLGIASQLMKATYDVLKNKNNLTILSCSYAIAYFKKHKEYQNILK